MSSETPQAFTSTPVPARLLGALAPAVLIALVLLAIGRLANLPDLIRAPDAWFYDLRTALFSPRVAAPRDDITVVLIDDESLGEGYASRSPVDRGLQATLVKGLAQKGAKAIGLDFVYDRKTTPEADGALLRVLKDTRSPPIVLGAIDANWAGETTKSIQNQEDFLKAAGQTAAHIYFARQGARFTIGDQVIRYWLGPSPNPPSRKGFAQALAEAAGHRVRLDEEESQLIAWQKPPEGGGYAYPFRLLRVKAHKPGAPIEDMLYPGWEAFVKDRIVLVGGGFEDIDRHLTPLTAADHQAVPGVTVHAQILAQFLDGRQIARSSVYADFLMLVAAFFAGAGVAALWGWRSGDFQVWVVGGLAVLIAGAAAFGSLGIIIPSGALYLAIVAGAWFWNPPRWIEPVVSRFSGSPQRKLGGPS